MKIIVTGGAGFVGSALVRYLINETHHQVVVIDKLTYASNLESLRDVSDNERFSFIRSDICNRSAMEDIFENYQPDRVIHLAAESHVDRSISGPEDFIKNNIIGTYVLLEVSNLFWSSLPENKKNNFKLLHVSTDEVYGDLGENSQNLTSENSAYAPSSPYAASKASSDHLVWAWWRTYGLPVVITHCSNNFGPYQYPEKLIPLVILNAISGKNIPIYGNGEQVRDWLHVDDHIRAIYSILEKGKIGDSYNISSNNEVKNIDLVTTICSILDDIFPESKNKPHNNLIEFVEDRLGHDFRYALDTKKLNKEIGWKSEVGFEDRLKETVLWYVRNFKWLETIQKY
ncbi:dTDP-glucose 4,6-dehydratase [Paenalcaligenes suwonensis]|uniref:dTDP-glucose 4,6-dehydratase n=1 Tax=Paenalcaligenes suwonensis TaxID=1202713 RepID=UPI00140D3D56|nr:dTDP-glucose 4,6-dehydratase [Paenalcaligenes suwonensis]NHC60262.1 dTDP-glucose 4,6-dehydratase [Paenalcaligenes suwonensis]